MADNPLNLTIDDTVLDTWFERDRAYVILYEKTESGDFGDTIIEIWDEAVEQAFEDGFLDRRKLHQSLFDYAAEGGLLDPAGRIKPDPVPVGWVIHHEELGALMTWRGGEMVWSSAAGQHDLDRGAVVFSDEDAAREFFNDDESLEFNDLLMFQDVILDTTPEGHTMPRRASIAAMQAEGIDLRIAVPAATI